MVAAVLLVTGTCSAYAQNTVTLGSEYKPGQRSARKLAYVLPSGWMADAAVARTIGLHAVLLPAGTNLENARAAITVAFQLKDPKKPGLVDLQSFVRVDMQNMLAAAPETEAKRWQPKGLNPDKVPFMSFEFYGPPGSKVSPQHVVYLDAGDGYFSVSLTVESRDALNAPEYEAFFSSLALE